MTTNPTDLAAALNECMPLTVDGETYVAVREFAGHATWFSRSETDLAYSIIFHDREIIGILWAECVRRGWPVAFHVDPPEVVVWPYRGNGRNKVEGNDALAFARAFAAAKRAEGGGA